MQNNAHIYPAIILLKTTTVVLGDWLRGQRAPPRLPAGRIDSDVPVTLVDDASLPLAVTLLGVQSGRGMPDSAAASPGEA